MSSCSRTPLSRLRGALHGLMGRICFRLGSGDRARRHFERVLELSGDNFTAYLYLSRLAYSVGDYAGWRRELEHARRTAPDRFALQKFPFELFEPMAAGTILEETGERATWRAMRMSSVGGQVEGELLGERGLTACPGGSLRRYGDDFCSDQERQKFSMLLPIEPADIAAADMDRLLKDLSSH
ncbi:MAG: tetratricopeptide repeat protein [Planctomycetota bacterium]